MESVGGSMTSLVQGLYPYEIVIMGLGALLFVVMLIALIAYLFQGKPVGGLVVFFILSIAMLGYPSLKSIEYQDGVLSLGFYEQQLQKNPDDAQARDGLSKGLKVVQGRPADEKASLAVAKAQWALGDEQAATKSLEPALRAQSTIGEAKVLKDRIENVQKLAQLTEKAEQNPAAVDRAELERQLNQVTSQTVVSPQTAGTVARAHAVLGQREQAAQSAKKALALKPDLVMAPQLKAILKQ
jgi:tetratricopeptide (TPR) repeat protein